MIEKSFFVDNNVYYFENFVYYNLNNFNNLKHNAIVINYFILSISITCRRCKKVFFFNNKLYIYFRNNNCLNVNVRLSKTFNVADRLKKTFNVDDISRSRKNISTIVYVSNVDFIIKTSKFFVALFIFKISIINFDVDVFKNIEIEYKYRE